MTTTTNARPHALLVIAAALFLLVCLGVVIALWALMPTAPITCIPSDHWYDFGWQSRHIPTGVFLSECAR